MAFFNRWIFKVRPVAWHNSIGTGWLANRVALGKHIVENPPDRTRKILEGLHNLLLDENSTIHFAEFNEISDTMMDGYARFIRLGLPGQTVALAMLGATVNLYRLFDMRDELPDILRGLASQIEQGEQKSN